ncbi:MAG: NAD(+)/NADH kinase [Bacillota bacterium]
MVKIGIIINPNKTKAQWVASEVKNWAEKNGIQIVLMQAANELSLKEELRLNYVLVLGGDGTLLQAARKLAPLGVPILGINLGNLGFLTAIELSELQEGLRALANNEVDIEERMMLEARVIRNNLKTDQFLALNDVVISKGSFARMIRIGMKVSNQVVGTLPCDGLIVSSPTGSTAYCLSAGGPIVSPELEAMILTPICPHNLYSRPIVVSPTEVVQIHLVTQGVEAMLTVDGQHGIHLGNEDVVEVKRSKFRVRLIQLKGRNFFEILRYKMQEGSSGDNFI